MLAGQADLSKLRYPVAVTPKIDGIRCLIVDGVAVSRSWKPIRNRHVQALLEGLPDGLDGELVVVGGTFQDTTSGIMSEWGTPTFTYQVFDWAGWAKHDLREGYLKRVLLLSALYTGRWPVEKVLPQIVASEADLEDAERMYLSYGHEGIMIRDPDGPYKEGRSTTREGYLLKLKRFVDTEAVVIGFEELLLNQNEATRNAFGHTTRSADQAGLVRGSTLGALLVHHPTFGTFSVGTGFSAAQRGEIWHHQLKYLNRVAKIKYQEVGILEKPRFPVFIGFRAPEDV